ncbi:MAG: glycosyltransferase family 4 protein [Candidatus Lindowbacteria bacterium]|nr:glycosyltransferase family 4 protein [Candidatus Lindowbacteria bacterium]
MTSSRVKKAKVCCYLPESNGEGADHLQHVRDLLRSVSDRCDIFLVVTRSAEREPPAFTRRFYANKFAFKPLRMLETFAVFLTARLLGYRAFYIHYSLWNAILARIVTSIVGGTVYQWHCHCGETNGNAGSRLIRRLHPWLKSASFRLSDSVVTASPTVARWYLVHTLSKEKGAHHLRRIIPLILQSSPKVTFLVAGQGKYREQICELPNVTMLGAVPNAEMPRIYSAADLIIMPSEAEGVPRVLLEAMAMGVPFVATAVGGVADLVGEALSQFLVPRGDVEAFAKRVLELLNDKALAEQVRQRGLERARLFTIESASQQFLEKIR